MEIHVNGKPNLAVVKIQAKVMDASNAPSFKEQMEPVIEANGNVLLDVSSLEFLDSSGLGAVLSCLRKLTGKGGDMKLCGMTKPVRALFELVRMHRIIEVYNTQDEAENAFSG
jgi:anti-sigma B factor antagonist